MFDWIKSNKQRWENVFFIYFHEFQNWDAELFLEIFSTPDSKEFNFITDPYNFPKINPLSPKLS